MTTFDGPRIEHALNELAEELDRSGVQADLFVVGGAAIALAFNTRRPTRDIRTCGSPAWSAAGLAE